MANQIMAPHPLFCLRKPLPAFARIVVDYDRPFITVQGRGKKGIKIYFRLFTCFWLQAVHLEITYGLDTDSFLNEFFQMTSKNGLLQEVISDNGINFVGASSELRNLINQLDEEKMKISTVKNRIKWHFNLSLGLYFGGVGKTISKLANKTTY